MSGFEPSNAPPDPLGKAALEPVDFSGSIQSYGILLALSEPELIMQQVSANVQDYLGISSQSLLGQPLERLLDAASIAVIRQELKHCGSSSRSSLQIWKDERCFNGTVYRTVATIVLELEPTCAQLGVHPLQMHSRVKQTITQLRQVSDWTDFLQFAVAEIRHITGFDRVMVYQFDAQGAGAVVAEAKRDDLPPYVGLHYPATDIPEPVRLLYQRGLVRYIPDLSADSVALVPTENPMTQQPLDLSLSGLRSVDPCCVEYHHNMGVAAILVISLIQGETLWGLISCHHQTPNPVAYEVRESCELLGQLIASELANKVNTRELDDLVRLRSLQSEFIQSISQADDLKQALVHPAPRLLDLVSAQGAAVCLEDEITLVGTTPSLAQVRLLIQWIETQRFVAPALSLRDSFSNRSLFHTDSLPKLYPAAEAFKDSASGLLVLQISQVRRYTLLWFRPEVLQTINWAGNPNESLQVDTEGSITLCPRKSFERWQEIVRFTSLPGKSVNWRVH
jgi:light-regulated signal transduction histidine kinase (bacteriophytochrome)